MQANSIIALPLCNDERTLRHLHRADLPCAGRWQQPDCICVLQGESLFVQRAHLAGV